MKDAGPVLDLFLRDADSSFSDAAFLCAISLAKQAHALGASYGLYLRG